MAWCNGHESVVATESIANVESTDWKIDNSNKSRPFW